jgi:4-amino-4-deoxy-L-arabinose transferase-like glycosyltransferase
VISFKLNKILFFLISISSLILTAYSYTGYFASDDISYLSAIKKITDPSLGFLSTNFLGETRLGMNIPYALIGKISGSSNFIIIVSSSFYYYLLILISYFIGKKFDQATAINSAIISCFNPLLYLYSGVILPDIPMSFWLSVSLLIFLHLFNNAQNNSIRISIMNVYIFLAGVCVGLGYMVKESALIMIVPAFLSITTLHKNLFSKATITSTATFLIGLLFILGLEALLIYHYTSKWIFRLNIVSSQDVIELYKQRIAIQGYYPWERFFYVFKNLTPYFGFTYFILFLACAYIFSRNYFFKSKLFIILIWFIWPAIYLTIGTTNFFNYLPPPIQHPRYYTPCAIPASLILSYFLTNLFKVVKIRSCSVKLSVLISITLGVYLFIINSPKAGNIYRSQQTRAFFSAYEDALEMPEYQIVLSSYPSDRFSPLFMHIKNLKRTFFAHYPNSLPKPPYILIAPVDDRLGDETKNHLFNENSKSIEIKPVGKKFYWSPRTRLEQLKLYLSPILNNLTEKTSFKKRADFKLYLISEKKKLVDKK